MPKKNKKNVDLGVVARLPPKEAISYFEAKGYNISWNWYEMLGDVHARAFTVAKCANLDVLNSLRDSVHKTLAEGMTQEQFIKELTPTLQKMGWWGKQVVVDSTGAAQVIQLGSPRRLATIYQTNTRTAYAAGRYAQMMNTAESFPYWQYVAVMDTRTRPPHAELNLMVFRYDDPFWQTHYPPNDWECRCRVRAYSEARFKASGIDVTDSTGMLSTKTVDAGVDVLTGEVYQTTVTTFNNGRVKMTPGAGWSYNVGAAAFGTDSAACRKLIETPDPNLRRQFIQSLNNAPARRLDFAVFVRKALEGKALAGAVQCLGFVSDNITRQISTHLDQAPARLMTVTPERVQSIVQAGSHKSAQRNVTAAMNLPTTIAEPRAVLFDPATHELLYVNKNATTPMVVIVPMNRPTATFDTVIDAKTMSHDALKAAVDDGRYKLIEGAL